MYLFLWISIAKFKNIVATFILYLVFTVNQLFFFVTYCVISFILVHVYVHFVFYCAIPSYKIKFRKSVLFCVNLVTLILHFQSANISGSYKTQAFTVKSLFCLLVTDDHHFIDGDLLYQFQPNFGQKRKLSDLITRHQEGRKTSIPVLETYRRFSAGECSVSLTNFKNNQTDQIYSPENWHC